VKGEWTYEDDMVLFMTGVYLVGVFDKLGVRLPLMMATKSAKHFLYCDDQHRVPWVFAMYPHRQIV
jgi:hypothetical protein